MAQQAFVAGQQGSALTITPPNGDSLIINITGGIVTSDAAGATAVVFPAAISSATTYYSQNASTLAVSCQWNGNECADGNGNTFGWFPRGGAYASITPMPTAAQTHIKASGTAVLVAGTKAVTDARATANSRILLTVSVPGGTQGAPFIGALGAGSFTIKSTSGTDTSTIAYYVVSY